MSRAACAWLTVVGISCASNMIFGCSSNHAAPSNDAAAQAEVGNDATGVGSIGADGGAATVNPLASIPRDEQWHFVPFANATCADGTQTGIGVNFTTKSDDVMIHLGPGGACWDETTCAGACAINIHTGYDETHGTPPWSTFASGAASTGIQSRKDPSSPFASMNYVEVFYCTGDVHAGDNIASYTVLGRDGAQHPAHHTGRANLLAYAAAVASTFPDAHKVVLAGPSAGGFGSYYSYDAVAPVLAPLPIFLIDDSGPVLQAQFNPSTEALTAEYTNWGLASTLTGCANCNPTNGGDPVNIAAYLAQKYPEARMALVSSVNDDEIRQRYALDGPGYAAALQSLATQVLDPLPSWRHFFVPGSTHTMLDVNLAKTTSCGVEINAFDGKSCSPSLDTFFDEMLNVGDGGAWTSVDPTPGAPGGSLDAGNLSACNMDH